MKKIIIALLAACVVGGVLAGCGGNNTPQPESSAASEQSSAAAVSSAENVPASKEQKAANTIIEKIDAIGKVGEEKADAIKAARKAYNSASADVKKLVTNFAALKMAENKMEYIDKCKEYSYREITKNHDELKGVYAKFTGKVVQVMEADDHTELLFDLIEDRSNESGDTVIYVSYTPWADDSTIAEGDNLTLYGKLSGMHYYENRAMHMVNVPLFYAQIFEVHELIK